MNNVCIIGRITKDIELKEYGKGKDKGLMCRFNVAVQRDKETADFIPCTAFGKTAELLDAYTVKGTRIGIEGRLQSGKYETEDGTTRYTLDLIVSRAHFADSVRAGEDVEEERPKKTYKRH